MAVKKCRTWWFVQRIDNLPRDWEKILEDLLIPGAYIVHDRDTKLDEETGELLPVAPHVHCILTFNSQVLVDTALSYLPDDFGVKFIQPVPNRIGAYRYLMHYGKEDKAQYDRDEIRHMHGFKVNMSEVYNLDFSDVYALIEQYDIRNFAVLVSLVVEFKPELMPYIAGHTNLVKSYLQERKNMVSSGKMG